MPFKSEKQRKWMHANEPEMAKKWEKEEESVEEAKKRDYKAEYKKYGSSTKAKKYRAELNKYNRQKGTYGNGDKKDASHKGGKIVGFEEQSKNRGRREKSRLKKEQKLREVIKKMIIDEGFADKFMKSVDKHNQKIVDNALALAKQQAPKDIDKSSKKTPKLIAIKTINRMKELRNKTKSPALKQTFQKTIDKLEKDYKKLKEGSLTEKKETAIDVAKRIVKNHQHEKGVDVQTANLIMKIYHAYDKNPALQKKLEKLPLKKLAQGVWRFVK